MLLPVAGFADDALHPIKACHEFVAEKSADSTNKAMPDIRFKKGMLWQIEKNNKTNYIFGTIHSQDYAVTRFPPQVRLALLRSRTLLMETIPSEAANQTFFDSMYFSNDQRLDSLLDEEVLQAFRAIATEYGIEADKVGMLKPWAAFSLIGRPKPVRAASLEMNLLNVARQSVRRIESLETMEEIIESLEKLSLQDQVTILTDTICNHSQIIRDAKTLVDLYVARDLQGIVEFNSQPHHDEAVFERFMQAILYDRNDKTLKIIEKAFAEGNTFVAMGASHLADKRGFLNQLYEKGYTITALY